MKISVFGASGGTGLQLTRQAAGKLLNSLSWHPRIHVPESVADGTILRIDLRDYKWSAALWEKLAAVYPYRFRGLSVASERAIAQHKELDAKHADIIHALRQFERRVARTAPNTVIHASRSD